MRSQHDIPHYSAMLDEAPALSMHTVTTMGPGDHPLDVAVWTTTQQRPDLIILLHGVLADHRAWRFVTGRLDDDHDLLLVDLPGSGQGEMLNPKTLKAHDATAYSLDGLAPRTAEAISAVLAGRAVEPQRIAIVAHSLGSLVTLRMLADHLDEPARNAWIDKVDRIALISPVDPALPYGPPSLETIATTSGTSIEFGEAFGLVRERIALGAERSFDEGNEIPREQADALYEIVTDTKRRRVAQDMLQTIIPTIKIDGVYYPDWDRIEPFVEDVRELGDEEDIAWLLVIGERDEVAPGSMAYRLASYLGQAGVIVIARTKHSPQLERPKITSSIIADFLGSDDAAVGATVNEERITPSPTP